MLLNDLSLKCLANYLGMNPASWLSLNRPTTSAVAHRGIAQDCSGPLFRIDLQIRPSVFVTPMPYKICKADHPAHRWNFPLADAAVGLILAQSILP